MCSARRAASSDWPARPSKVRGAPGIAALGILSLIGFAVAFTRVDGAFAGRAYAPYGGIYIAASLVWLWGVEGQRPLRRPGHRPEGGTQNRLCVTKQPH